MFFLCCNFLVVVTIFVCKYLNFLHLFFLLFFFFHPRPPSHRPPLPISRRCFFCFILKCNVCRFCSISASRFYCVLSFSLLQSCVMSCNYGFGLYNQHSIGYALLAPTLLDPHHCLLFYFEIFVRRILIAVHLHINYMPFFWCSWRCNCLKLSKSQEL